ncbi:hypothetical protein AB1L07_01860 [Niallia alba]|uniref:hypothetical protein n=1 Tax=Niallia alba TaxID=2729105 RepID=UPI0039A0EC73
MAVVADVFEALMLDGNGEVYATGTVQDSNIEVSVQSNDVNGGQGNELLGVLHSTRNINVTVNDINFRYDWLARQFGQDIVTGAGTAYAMPVWEVAKDNAGVVEVELENEPITAHQMKIYNEDGEKVTGFTVTGKKVDLTSATPEVAIGDEIEIRTYIYATPASSQQFEIDNKVFAKGTHLILQTLEVDESEEEPTHKIQYEFYKAIPEGNMTINTASERSAQTSGHTFRVVKPKRSKVVGVVKRIPIEA